MWLNELKIALIEKDMEQLDSLMDNLPSLEKKEDITTAIYLLKEATSLVETLRDDTQTSMVQMKKNINFLKSTQAPLVSKLDINS